MLHELATNAAKYGAWTTSKGQVDLRWTRTEGQGRDLLKLVWRERKGPAVKPPERAGFGSRLIQKGIPGAKVNSQFLAHGVVHTLELWVPRSKAP